jgi:hypothetical protein
LETRLPSAASSSQQYRSSSPFFQSFTRGSQLNPKGLLGGIGGIGGRMKGMFSSSTSSQASITTPSSSSSLSTLTSGTAFSSSFDTTRLGERDASDYRQQGQR